MSKLYQLENPECLFPFLKEAEFIQNPLSLVHLPLGTCILREGEYGTHIPLVIQGMIRVVKISESGRAINLYRVNRGESCILLMSSALAGIPYPATAIIEEDTHALLIPVKQFNNLMNRYESVRAFVCSHLTHRLISMITLIDEIVFKRMDQRLAEFILDNTSPEQDFLTTTHEEISLELGTAREVVSRLLKDLEKNNWISVRRGKITVIERSALKKSIHRD
ncbi:Crp/Fnr family transcriptional regulator [Desulfitobacterium sp. Sab5]|uniref:Crp/Fnr family transcriptional regulator n=1 Tax=Desulfitobacterium nosdiversum TaxID=3375356 RepID=UPI003CE6CC9F